MSQWAPFRVTKKLRSSRNIIPAAGWERPACLLVVSVFLTLWVATGNVDAGTLFQSPQSPAAQPPAEQPPVVQPPVEQPPAEQPPAEPPPAEQPPVEQAPVEQAPVEQPPAEAAPAEPAPAEQPPIEQPASDIAPTAAESAPPPEVSEPPEPEPISREREEAPRDEETAGSSNLILDQVELIDTVVVSGAYIWLCCGVGLFLFVPLLLLFVYIRGRSKMIQEQNF